MYVLAYILQGKHQSQINGDIFTSVKLSAYVESVSLKFKSTSESGSTDVGRSQSSIWGGGGARVSGRYSTYSAIILL